MHRGVQSCLHDNPANTKHLYNIYAMLGQRRRRWADVVLMLYKCFLFAGNIRLGNKTGSVLLSALTLFFLYIFVFFF